MARLGVDLKDVDIEGVASLPEGVYQMQVGKSSVKTSKKGNRYISFPLQVVNHAELTGKKTYYDCYDSAPWKLKRLATACGALLPDGDVDEDLITGKTVAVNVTCITKHPETGEELKKHWNELEVVL